ncbi:hypothetical protein E2320_007159, partial [Naja naja]
MLLRGVTSNRWAVSLWPLPAASVYTCKPGGYYSHSSQGIQPSGTPKRKVRVKEILCSSCSRGTWTPNYKRLHCCPFTWVVCHFFLPGGPFLEGKGFFKKWACRIIRQHSGFQIAEGENSERCLTCVCTLSPSLSHTHRHKERHTHTYSFQSTSPGLLYGSAGKCIKVVYFVNQAGAALPSSCQFDKLKAAQPIHFTHSGGGGFLPPFFLVSVPLESKRKIFFACSLDRKHCYPLYIKEREWLRQNSIRTATPCEATALHQIMTIEQLAHNYGQKLLALGAAKLHQIFNLLISCKICGSSWFANSIKFATFFNLLGSTHSADWFTICAFLKCCVQKGDAESDFASSQLCFPPVLILHFMQNIKVVANSASVIKLSEKLVISPIPLSNMECWAEEWAGPYIPMRMDLAGLRLSFSSLLVAVLWEDFRTVQKVNLWLL